MSEHQKDRETQGLDRRDFLMAGAAGIAAAGTVGLAAGTASAKTIIPGEKLKTNATKGGKRVVLLNDALMQIGPPIAIELAQSGHNLVIAQPAEGLVDKLKSHGAEVVVVEGIEQEGPNDESQPGSTQKLVDAAKAKFGGFDAAYIRTAIHHAGDVLKTTREDMQKIFESNFLAVMDSLQALMPPLMKAGSGQILVLTSATGGKPYYDMMGYSTMRAAANMMIRCAAMTGAPKGVVVNAIRHELHQLSRRREDAGRPRQDGRGLRAHPGGPLRRAGRAGPHRGHPPRRAQHVRHRDVHPHGRRLQRPE